MRLLADECLNGRLVEGLRRAGHDVVTVRDESQGAGDRTILDRATDERRILVTEDKDFGDLVVHHGERVPGVVLVRYSQRDIGAVLQRLVAAVNQHGERLRRLYVVITPERTRLRRLGTPLGRRP
jgi:predicted nuclease of predicted toxin-antitoxin system